MDLIGRDREVAAASRALDAVKVGPTGILFEGEAGIGKSALWASTRDEAAGRGMLVLQTRPVMAEARLSFAALLDLVDPILDQALAELPVPQRRALGIALRRVEAGDEPLDQGAVAIATLTVLRSLSAARPVLLAVDDVQWLDRPSLAVLDFALRRLRDERIAVLATQRLGEERREPTLEQLLGDERVTRIAVGPLSQGAVHHLVRTRLGVSLARPTLSHLYESSGGNPLFVLELARARRPEGARPATATDLRTSVGDLLRGRLRRLPVGALRALLPVALLQAPTLDLVAAAMDDSRISGAIDSARAAGVLEAEDASDRRLRFSHPLFANAVEAEATPAQRRTMHRRLAGLVPDTEGRARHLALSTEGPDGMVADAVDAAALLANARGAGAVELELRELALQLTPEAARDDYSRRRVAFADALFTAGDTVRARQELEAALPSIELLETRLEATLLLATVLWFVEKGPEPVRLAEQALAEAAKDPAWQARIHGRLSWMCEDDLQKSDSHAEAALALLDQAQEPALYGFALLNHAMNRLFLGLGADHNAVALGDRLQEAAGIWDFSSIPANWAKWMDDLPLARKRLDTYLERSRAMGEESAIAQLLGYRSELECWAGATDESIRLANEAVELAEQMGQDTYLGVALARRGYGLLQRGDPAAAVEDGRRSLTLAEHREDRMIQALALGLLGQTAFVAGRPADADADLTRATALLDAFGMRDQAAFRFHSDHIEAVIQLGDFDRASALLARHDERGHVVPRPWILATAARCRGLLLAAQGDFAGAQLALNRALVAHQQLEMPVEAGRTLLALGQVQRRGKERRQAAVTLALAIGIFDGVGASLWSEIARAEQRRLGVRHVTGAALTAGEESVARLAATGLTNREVADRLFISAKTVESNLARAYGKLQIRSRAELGSVMATRVPPVA